MLAHIQGLDTYYTLEGSGPPVVLLHGWGASSQSLQGPAAALAAEFRVLSADLPGFGWSDPPPAAWGTVEYADHLRALLDGLGLGRAALLGHSFGGRVAIQLAARTPERVERLVLVASAGVRRRRRPRDYARLGVTKLVKALAALPLVGRLGRPLQQRWAERVGSRDYKAAGRMRPTLVRVVNEDLAPLLPDIQAPTLLLWGDQDEEVRREAVLTMASRIAGARLLVFPGAGHFPFLDAPERFLEALRGFLREGRA
ncbi:MAG: alpha/beta fold hydrolase [Candidatus Methylomirabilales bacterium]